MTLIDRHILWRFLASYLGSLLCMLLLYVVLDAFTRLDDFMVEAGELPPARVAQSVQGAGTTGHSAKVRASLLGFARNLGVYYAYRLPVIFDLVNSFVVLLAATFTLGWMEKQNELLPLLSAGVRMRRVFAPAWAATALFISLGVMNREALIPNLAAEILRRCEDPQGLRPLMIQGGFDDRGVHFDGRAAYPDRQLVMQGRVTLPADAGGDLVHLSCQEMYYRPPVDSHPGGWWLNGCTPPRLAEQRGYLREVRPGEYFIETNLSFERLTRRPNWFVYLDTGSLLEVVDREEQCPRRAEVIATLHGRVTRPLAELLIVLISLPLLVGCPQRSLYIKVGSILALFAASQVLDTVSFGLARNDYLNPSLAAWLPVLIFGPWSLAACDATRT